MTSLTSGLASRLTWTQSPEFRVTAPRTVVFLRVDRRPHADRAVLRVQARDRHLDGEAVDAVAGEEVLAAAGVARALADRDEIEDRADVAEERVVTLTRERHSATCDGGDRLGDERVVVRGRARPDVVRRRGAACDDRRLATVDARDRERLRGVAEEVRPGLRLELEAVDDVGSDVAVRVDLEVVPRGRRERVPVRAGRGILARQDVREDRDGAGLVGAAERVEVRQVGTSGPPRSKAPHDGSTRCRSRAQVFLPHGGGCE